MWVWHACLSSPHARCDPQTWGQWAEFLGALVLAFALILAAFLGLLSRG